MYDCLCLCAYFVHVRHAFFSPFPCIHHVIGVYKGPVHQGVGVHSKDPFPCLQHLLSLSSSLLLGD